MSTYNPFLVDNSLSVIGVSDMEGALVVNDRRIRVFTFASLDMDRGTPSQSIIV